VTLLSVTVVDTIQSTQADQPAFQANSHRLSAAGDAWLFKEGVLGAIGLSLVIVSHIPLPGSRARFSTLAKLCCVLDCRPGVLIAYDLAGEPIENDPD
jgi:hypothetical protein